MIVPYHTLNACQTFCVSRYIAHTCRGRLKMSEGKAFKSQRRGLTWLLSHRGSWFSLYFASLRPSNVASPDCCHIGALNWRLLSGMYVWTCKKFCRESNPGRYLNFHFFGGGALRMSGLIGEPAKKSAESRTRTAQPLFFNVGISIFWYGIAMTMTIKC